MKLSNKIKPAQSKLYLIAKQNKEIEIDLTKYFNAKENEVLYLHQNQNIIATYSQRQQESKKKSMDRLRVLGKYVMEVVEREEIESLEMETDLQEDQILCFLEGMLLWQYCFDKYKTIKRKKKEVSIFVKQVKQSKLDELTDVLKAVSTARELVNEPVCHLNSLQFSEKMQQYGEKYGFEVEVLHKKDIEKLKMGGILAVNKGSETPATFNIIKYKPKDAVNEKPYVLVGKGVTYDTGGYNLKPGEFMAQMKSDMAGAATVVGVAIALAKNKIPLYFVGLVPSTDNKINSNAMVADDIITMMDGTSVEIINTDAEGRLILADALTYAKKFDPELVIDLATLTGAAHRVTGHYGAAMMGEAKEQTKEELKQSAEQTYERLIEMPFWEDFEENIKSNVADIKNSAGAIGGASTAGKFLQVFTLYPWIHIDIAGPAYLDREYKYYREGATGFGVRLIYDFLKKKTKN